MTIGEKIKQRREELNLSQEELAKILGYKSRSSINKIEKEGQSLPFNKIVDFATALSVEPAYFIDWQDYKNQIQPVTETWNNLTSEQHEQQNLVSYFSRLNEEGQKKVLDYALDLTFIKKYNKKK